MHARIARTRGDISICVNKSLAGCDRPSRIWMLSFSPAACAASKVGQKADFFAHCVCMGNAFFMINGHNGPWIPGSERVNLSKYSWSWSFHAILPTAGDIISAFRHASLACWQLIWGLMLSLCVSTIALSLLVLGKGSPPSGWTLFTLNWSHFRQRSTELTLHSRATFLKKVSPDFLLKTFKKLSSLRALDLESIF